MAGCALRKLEKKNAEGGILLTKRFTYIQENGKTSGKIMSQPTYSNITSMSNGYMIDFACVSSLEGLYLLRTTNTQVPLALNQGVHVGYSRVREEYVATTPENNGYKIYKYKNHVDETFGLSVPTASYSYKNGLLLSEQVFTSDNRILEEVVNEYDSSGYSQLGKSFRIYEVTNSGCVYCINRKFEYQTYFTPTERFELRTTSRTVFDPIHTTSLTNLSEFYYNEHEQLDSLVQFVRGVSDPRITQFKYHDFDRTALTEKYSYYSRDNGQKLFVSGEYYLYNQYVKPSAVSMLEESGEPSTFPLYTTRLEYTAFSNKGKPLAYRLADNVTTSIIWDTNNEYPVAQVINAQHDEIYYAGFEETGTLGVLPSNPARTGERYQNNGTYNFSSNGFVPVSTTNLKMSYWYWSSNKWNFSGVINWSNTISAGSRLDEIRVFPGDSQMTTYTYDPGIGVTSQTDANNVTIYYEYDSFGRLKFVRDGNRNILRQTDYHYKTQE